MKRIEEILDGNVRTIGIAGHVSPDGDCVGSCCALYLYLKRCVPADLSVDLYLKNIPDPLLTTPGAADAKEEAPEGKIYDLFIVCDVSDYARIEVAGSLFDSARRRVCIDHHVSNDAFADINHVEPEASACAEVLTWLLDMDLADRDIATCLYTGIINDCGVFQYSCTSPRTMRTAALLMEKGVDFQRIIDETFNRRTFQQNQLLAFGLVNARLCAGGRCIASLLKKEDMDRMGVTRKDLDVVVPELRYTRGVEVAVFVYETGLNEFKVSFRSNDYLNVAEVARSFGGGGHERAAGCTIYGSGESAVKAVTDKLEKELDKYA
ncbi:MAG: bifunctional oligoribonuclease/PAP phosphatase NrnA [Lachnospiraceae bacterium]|nr:bifunctional oligoribonuclease/PAP phosphatase NrnA [Lachnospiraceae bacterium]